MARSDFWVPSMADKIQDELDAVREVPAAEAALKAQLRAKRDAQRAEAAANRAAKAFAPSNGAVDWRTEEALANLAF